jgi:hypothetical protein
MSLSLFNSRHLAIIGAAAIGVTNIVMSGDQNITIGAIGVMGAAFTWDKIEKNLSSKKE